ncbi:L-2-hydroxyglutarate oxidase [Lacunimicrobium album]
MQTPDALIIGAGIVGLATAYQLSNQYPSARLLVIDKEPGPARHQTGHNSGVIHSGIYYTPGSKKALTCRAGKAELETFCTTHSLPFDRCGKVIVATTNDELPRLQSLYERGQQNGVDCRLIDPHELKQLEPHAAGLAAIHVPETGIVDYVAVCQKLVEILSKRNTRFLWNTKVISIQETRDRVIVRTPQGDHSAPTLIACAGLQSDRIAKAAGLAPACRIVPFKGEYFELTPDAHHLCNNLIYPVPDPRFPFLGVHFTRMIHGGIESGPNAVLALAREGYGKFDFNLQDTLNTLASPSFLHLASTYWRMGLGEIHRSLSKPAFVKALQKLIPEIRSHHLTPATPGIRAQALSTSGQLVDDFLWAETERMVHVLNAPSPAATASLQIAKEISLHASRLFS